MNQDVLGYKLPDALNLLKENGFNVSVISTKPPKGNPEGIERVIKVENQGNDLLVVTVACEDKGKGGVHNGL